MGAAERSTNWVSSSNARVYDSKWAPQVPLRHCNPGQALSMTSDDDEKLDRLLQRRASREERNRTVVHISLINLVLVAYEGSRA